jgi:PhnB protein
MKIEPYLFLDGRCEEAIAFYREALGAEVLMLMRYSEAPPNPDCPVTPGSENKIMHSALRVGDAQLMLSDGFASGNPRFEGFALSITANSDAEARTLFDALGDGGKVTAPLEATFFATSFGMVSDRFGMHWMVLVPKPMP